MEYNWTLTTNPSTAAHTAWESSWPTLDHYFVGAGNAPEVLSRNPDPNMTVLKLGKRHYFAEDTAAPPPKNGKGYCGQCQVEGCDTVLVDAKEYHRRHKVCEVHSKSPRVVVLGIEQRFCQQCSRFHELSEFDESKRSCRRRLAGHNLRRRKHHSQAGKHTAHLLNTGECALSLLSSSPNYNPWMVSDDLPARCSAALHELIAEKRASVSARRQQLNEYSDRERQEHVTLDLMQDPASGLLSVYGHRAHKEGGEGDCSEMWRDVPFGY